MRHKSNLINCQSFYISQIKTPSKSWTTVPSLDPTVLKYPAEKPPVNAPWKRGRALVPTPTAWSSFWGFFIGSSVEKNWIDDSLRCTFSDKFTFTHHSNLCTYSTQEYLSSLSVIHSKVKSISAWVFYTVIHWIMQFLKHW